MVAARASDEDLEPGPVSVVDDDPTARAMIRRFLEDEGYRVVEHANGRDALIDLSSSMVLCLDLGLDDMSGLDVLRHVQAREPSLPVVVVTAEDDVATAVLAMRGGAYDYLVKPIDRIKLQHAVRRAFEKRQLAKSIDSLKSALGSGRFQSIVGKSEVMRELARQIEKVIDSDAGVAIYGESGTGKELVARTIHKHGRRASAPFVAVNCAAIPEALHESELFGPSGRFEQAHKGTLFLDEVGDMSLSTQAVLWRALQERNVCVICATKRDLREEVRAGRFREDLYFRLVVYPITVPPLHARTEDLPLLVAHFLKKHSSDVGREVTRISADAMEAITRYRWPGNVRELENVVHRAMLSAESDEIRLSDLSPHVRATVLSVVPSSPAIIPLKELEHRAILQALQAADWNITRAAKLLGMGRATLYRRIAESGGLDAFKDG